MTYTQATGRRFWFEFDDYFKYKAGQNGLAQRYEEMGGYQRPAQEWLNSRAAGTYPATFTAYANSKGATIDFLAAEQKRYFDQFFIGDMADVIAAFQDFAFGILATPGRFQEPVHTMNGGLSAEDYLSWHGFIEGALVRGGDAAFWRPMRWINGMAWELQSKARPQEVLPNINEPLPAPVTQAIRDKWEVRTADQIGVEFDNYRTRPIEWLQAA